MKKIVLITMLLTGVFTFGQELKINNKEAKIEFNFVSEGVKGTIKGFQAVVKFNASDPSSSSITGSVDVSKLSTGNSMRDKHLKTDEFFDAVKYPKITFTSTGITKDGDSFKMKGKVKIKDVEKAVVFTFTYKDKKFVGKTTIYSEDFGVMKKKERAKSQVDITIEIAVL